MYENVVIIAPLFIIMLLGFALGKINVFPEGSGAASSLSTFVWYIAIPALIFKLLATRSFPGSEEFEMVMGYYIMLYLFYFTSAFLVAPWLNYKKAGYGIFAFSCTYGNLGFIGIPLIQGIYGEEGLRILLMLISFHMATLLPITSFMTELARQDAGRPLKILSNAMTDSVKNPVVVSLIVSLAWAASGVGVSPIVIRILDFPADAAAPVALFAVGLSLSRVKIKGDLIPSLIPVTIKLCLLPLAVYLMLTRVMDIPVLWAKTATLAACMPTGVNAYNIAVQYDIAARPTASTIMLGTVLSTITLMIAVSLL